MQRHARRRRLFALALSFSLPRAVFGHEEIAPPDEIVVIGRAQNLIGVADSASTGRVGADELRRVPFLRVGEVLERVPGLIVTQHSGTGKANQFFLRGFNLDHGTDFSAFVEGVPLNLTTHGHGQGYLDLNPIIPELIEVVDFRKGPYFADVGDFSSAGTSSIAYVRRLERPFVATGFGQYDYYRVVSGGSAEVGGGDLLVAGEAQLYEGPWDLDEDLEKFNGLAKWTRGDADSGLSLLATGYSADWNSTDQIPRRAVAAGLVDRLGNLDDDLGGDTSRYAASGRWWHGRTNQTRAQGYLVFYDFDLWSNFTYFLDDPENGDEFQQFDQRIIAGLDLAQDYQLALGTYHLHNTFGLQTRRDAISDVGLYRTAERKRLDTVREDDATVHSLGLWWRGETEITDWLRAYGGLRSDFYWFDVDAHTQPQNSGNEFDGVVSPKVGLVLGPWADTEVYLNYGRGFHSNDARGTTIEVDPSTGDPVDTVDPLVTSDGAEIGTRTLWLPGLQSTLALWWLDLDSELLFVGDAGTTEASRPSRRYGVEWANYYRPFDWLFLDVDVTFSQAEFRDDDPAGDSIPGAIESTVASGAAVEFDNGLFGSLRLRHFGERPLIEDDSVRSDPTTLVNLQAGWTWVDGPWGELTLTLDVLNLLDSKDDDITYFYASRLAGEPDGGVEDVHFHPVEPRSVRGYLTYRF